MEHLTRQTIRLGMALVAVLQLVAAGSAAADTLLDDFQDGNFWTPDTTFGWWDSDGSSVYQHQHVVSDPFGSQVMQVTYGNKTNYPWSAFAGFLSPVNTKRNFSVASGYGNFSANTVRIRVDSSTHERALLKLEDTMNSQRDVAYKVFGRSLDGRPLTVDFNYSKLYAQGGIDLGHIKNVMLFIAPGGTTTLATQKLLDDIQLVETAVLDDFENDGRLKLTWFDNGPVGGTGWQRYFPKFYSPPAAVTDDFAADGFSVMQVNYNQQTCAGCRFGATVTPAWQNFKAYRKLTFWVRNKSAPSALRLGIQLENESYNKSLIKTFEISSPEWTKIECDLAGLYFNSAAVFDVQTVRNILFSIDSAQVGQGAFQLDDVMLTH